MGALHSPCCENIKSHTFDFIYMRINISTRVKYLMRVLTDGKRDSVRLDWSGLDRAICGYVAEKQNGLVDDSEMGGCVY